MINCSAFGSSPCNLKGRTEGSYLEGLKTKDYYLIGGIAKVVEYEIGVISIFFYVSFTKK